jgi:hypothetical protein
MYRGWSLVVLAVAALLTANPTRAIVLGQIDDFQSGSLQGWTGGSAMTNQPTGGPSGAGDRYLRIDSGGVGGLLGTFNMVQWAGNYAAATVGRVNMDLSNFGPDPVSLRVMIMTAGCSNGAGGCTAWTSTNATVLPSGIGWVSADFSLLEVDLTRVLGSASYATTIASVERLLLHHDAGLPDPPGIPSPVNAVLGIDNVRALPEPSLELALSAGSAVLVSIRRRCR